MDDKMLEQLQKSLMDDLTKEDKQEKEMQEASEIIAKELLISKNNRTRAMIDDSPHSIMYTRYTDEKNKEERFCIFIMNETKFKLAPHKYTPAKIEAPVDKNLDEVENLTKMLLSYLQFKSGKIKPEELED